MTPQGTRGSKVTRLTSGLLAAVVDRVRSIRRHRIKLMLSGTVLFVGGLYLAASHIPASLSELSWWPAVVIFLVLAPLSVLYGAVTLKLSARVLSLPMSLSTALKATIMGNVAEILPVPGGAMARGSALVLAGGSISASGWIIAVTALLGGSCAAAFAGGALLVEADSSFSIGIAMLTAGALGALLCTALLISKSSARLGAFHLLLRIIGIALTAWRLHESFSILNVDVSMLTATLMVVSVLAGSAVSIVPAGFGVSEVIAAALGTLVTVGAAASFVAVAMNRLLGLASSGVLAIALVFHARKSTTKYAD